MTRIVREITPLTEHDFFIVLDHQNAKFDFPIHYHPEYELNLVLHSEGKRIIGDSIKNYDSVDLVLIGPNTPHAWSGNTDNARVITIQFQPNILSEQTLNRKASLPIKDLLNKSKLGVLFSEETTQNITNRILKLSDVSGFDSFLDFLSILYDLSISRNQLTLSSPSYVDQFDTSKSRRIKMVNQYLIDNLHNPIKIADVAEMVNMSSSAFSHFFKKRTQRAFSDYLLDIRIGHAARSLVETEKNISEICFESGFNNISNFNRSFKKLEGCTPREFRSQQKLITKH
ncbi:AraC family transcriptional regulator [Ancylomarina sp. 16SWW S1-10-2]|uniref:AraC family transcriptional regulator n=1 Tax=Ancylomarina sp. 16SWW S1-10-2 TaxID=2499681 RepID=UPI0012AD7F5B|nr:AraC family transcriptional regulator [Ancylomarina sp. 16SWW S1-10-2]MRT93715.1 AraC family transcriptional regulator [Ancylomarina sp. 16SWW S1-10-2]